MSSLLIPGHTFIQFNISVPSAYGIVGTYMYWKVEVCCSTIHPVVEGVHYNYNELGVVASGFELRLSSDHYLWSQAGPPNCVVY